ncbi:MAG: hypothetical protein EOO08_02115 [Chitinophagaceae bacterium]|nr:MAG: hypothetical protein EOO08_02115 [Chitinophagaceae bacterium]
MKRLLLLALPLLLAAALTIVCLYRPSTKGIPMAARLQHTAALPLPAADTTCSSNPAPVENPGGVHPTARAAATGGMTRPLPEWADVLSNYTEAQLDPRREGTVEGRQGTRLFFPAYAFQLPDGTVPDGPVTISLQEFYTPAAFALAGLSTMSNGRMIESGGMIYVDAHFKGQPLRLRKGASYDLDMPYTEKKKDMQLFSAVPDDDFNWQPLLWGQEETDRYYRDAFVGPATLDSLQQLLRSSLQWPQDVEGTLTWWEATIRFRINEEGKPDGVHVDNSMSPGFIALLDSALKQRPASVVAWSEGKPAAAAFHQRLTFRWPTEQRNARNFRIERSNLFVDSVYRKDGPGYYTFRSPIMGWINCDRYYQETRQLETLYVRVPDPRVNVSLQFTSLNAMMSGEPTNGGYLFENVPKGEVVNVVGLKKEGTCYELSLQTVRVGEDAVRPLRFEAMTLKQAHDRLKMFTRSKGPATALRISTARQNALERCPELSALLQTH